MTHALAWYLALQVLGLAVLPLALRLFGNLPGRGYAFARPIGLGLVSYLLWIGGTFGLWENRHSTVIVILTLLAAVCWGLLPTTRRELDQIWRHHRGVLFATEGLLLFGYTLFVLIRAQVPEIAGTEKPMEFAFLNAVLRAESFPPHDPWLSGFSISYYYFGYVMVAVLAMLARAPSSIAFNLAIPTLFGLTLTGAFALGYDLVAGTRERRALTEVEGPVSHGPGPLATGGLASLFVAVLANWVGPLELLHARGFGSPDFWARIRIRGLDQPYVSGAWHPTEPPDHWWWFRAARVIADYRDNGIARDYTINEFPFFSFILGDLHPHVLALPLAFVALGFALNVLRSPASDWTWLRTPTDLPAWVFGIRSIPLVSEALAFSVFRPLEWIRRTPLQAIGTGLLFGGFAFLNAWDLPTYLFILVVAFGLRRYLARRHGCDWLYETAGFGWMVLLLGIILYLPFYIGFGSQAAGLGIVIYRSQLHHFVIFWGPLLLLTASFVIAELRSTAVAGCPEASLVPKRNDWTHNRLVRIVVIEIAIILLLFQIPPLTSAVPAWAQAPALALILPLVVACLVALWRIVTYPITKGSAIGCRTNCDEVRTVTGDCSGTESSGAAIDSTAPDFARERCFVLVLALTSLLLIMGTELVFIRDLFGNRMNTVFKLYYQAWLMLGLVGAYAVHRVLESWAASRRPQTVVRKVDQVLGIAWLVLSVMAIASGLVYSPASALSRTDQFSRTPTLDGLAYLARQRPADYAAIRWLQANISGAPVILEATRTEQGTSYTEFGRVSANTGLPTVIGWDFHETQWRGTSFEQQRRKIDVENIYRTNDALVAQDLMEKYGVSYVYVGSLERMRYGDQQPGSLAKFAGFMDVVYDLDGVTIYSVREH